MTKGNIMGKGGPRHFVKPNVDQGLLFKALGNNVDLVQDLGGYEVTSKNQATNFAGLVEAHDLLHALVKVARTCEVHSSDLRSALLKLCADQPSVNNSHFKGEVWANMRQERICTLLAHLRRLKAPQELKKGAAKLKATDFMRLQSLLDLIVDKEAEEKKEAKKRKIDEVSLDEDGYPKELMTPSTKGKPLTKGSPDSNNSVDPSFLRRRVGRRALDSPTNWKAKDHDDGLAKAMGLKDLKKKALPEEAASTHGKPLPKGILKTTKKKPAASVHESSNSHKLSKAPLKKGKEDPTKKPKGGKWHRLKITYSQKPERAYITAQERPGDPFKLLVEVTKKRSLHYQRIIQSIHKEVERKGLSKQEALDLRSELC